MDGIEEKSKPEFLKWLLVALVGVFSLGLVGGGVFVYQKAITGKKVTPTTFAPTPSPGETAIKIPEVTPTPKTELKRSDLKIKVLNGTGVPGVAGKATEFLEKLGYEGVKTGNADSFDYEKTIVQIKESKKNYLGLIIDDLSKNYSLAESSKTLSEEEKFEVIIILGKD